MTRKEIDKLLAKKDKFRKIQKIATEGLKEMGGGGYIANRTNKVTYNKRAEEIICQLYKKGYYLSYPQIQLLCIWEKHNSWDALMFTDVVKAKIYKTRGSAEAAANSIEKLGITVKNGKVIFGKRVKERKYIHRSILELLEK